MARPKPARRRRGEGMLFKDLRRNCWVGRVPIGRHPNGRTMYREVSDPVQRRCSELMRQLQPPDKSSTIREFGEVWLNGLMVRPLTYDNYANSVRHRINPVLGHLRVAAVTPLQIEHAMKRWAGIYKPGTVRATLAHLSILFNAAMRAELVSRNPVRLVKRPPPPDRARQVYPPATLAAITAAACAEPWYWPIALLASTGMRKGECVALEVGDFDRDAGTIAIVRTSTRHHGTGPPKSRNSVRTIRVPSAALPAVLGAIGLRRAGPLFRRADGKQISHATIDWHWRRLADRLGIPWRSCHALRHSVATALVASGQPIADCAAFLGDSPAQIVATYIHPSPADPSRALDKMFIAKRKVKHS